MPTDEQAPIVIVAARNEADRIGATLDALRRGLPGGEADRRRRRLRPTAPPRPRSRTGAEVISRGRPHGKGGNAGAAAATVIERASEPGAPPFLLCDGDLRRVGRRSCARWSTRFAGGECDLAIAAFRRRVGGGFGIALRYAANAIERLCGYRATAPISGQRALSPAAMRAAYPFAAGYGMEIGITVDVVRAGLEVRRDRARPRPPGHRPHARRLRPPRPPAARLPRVEPRRERRSG